MSDNIDLAILNAIKPNFEKENPKVAKMIELTTEFNDFLFRCDCENIKYPSYAQFIEDKCFTGEYTELIERIKSIAAFNKEIIFDIDGEKMTISPFAPLIDPAAHNWFPTFVLKNGKKYQLCQIRFGYLLTAHDLKIVATLEEVEKII